LPFRLDHERSINTLCEPTFCFAPNGNWIAYSSVKDGTLEIWPYPMTENAKPQRLLGHRDAVDFICIADDSRALATTAFDDSLRVWELKPNQSIQSTKVVLMKGVGLTRDVAFSRNGRYVGVAHTQYGGHTLRILVYDRINKSSRSHTIPNREGEKFRAARFL